MPLHKWNACIGSDKIYERSNIKYQENNMNSDSKSLYGPIIDLPKEEEGEGKFPFRGLRIMGL